MNTLVDRMINGETLNGFYLKVARKEYFIKTARSNKTNALASAILKELLLPDNPDTRAEIMYWIMKASCQIKTTKSGHRYYNIFGDNFGGYGSDDITDGNTIIIEIK